MACPLPAGDIQSGSQPPKVRVYLTPSRIMRQQRHFRESGMLQDNMSRMAFEEIQMTTKLEQEEYLYRRAIDIIESADTDSAKEELLFEEVWIPLAVLYEDKLKSAADKG